jgi:hypothetical protein
MPGFAGAAKWQHHHPAEEKPMAIRIKTIGKTDRAPPIEGDFIG